MFTAYEFIFADIPSSMYGLYLCDFGNNAHTDNSFGNTASIIETRIPGRVRPLHFGVDYHKSPMAFKLIFGADEPLDRWQMQEVQDWLTGYQQYQWLSIEQPDLEHVQFRCLIKDLSPISVGWVPYAFQATVQCDCPYAYGYPFEKELVVDNDKELVVFNDGTAKVPFMPQMTIIPEAGCTEFSIENVTDGHTFTLSELPADGLRIFVDNENGVIVEQNYGYDLYQNFNDEFFRLQPGDNTLNITGSGTITLSGRFLYNVGA